MLVKQKCIFNAATMGLATPPQLHAQIKDVLKKMDAQQEVIVND